MNKGNYISTQMKSYLKDTNKNNKTIDVAVEELEKFLYLRSKYDSSFITVTPLVDNLWHEYILQTKEYHNLCYSLPGKKYIHHKTIKFNDYFKSKSEKAGFYKDQVKEVANYLEEFDEFSEEACLHWGLTKYLRENNIMTAKEINKRETWQNYID